MAGLDSWDYQKRIVIVMFFQAGVAYATCTSLVSLWHRLYSSLCRSVGRSVCIMGLLCPIRMKFGICVVLDGWCHRLLRFCACFF